MAETMGEWLKIPKTEINRNTFSPEDMTRQADIWRASLRLTDIWTEFHKGESSTATQKLGTDLSYAFPWDVSLNIWDTTPKLPNTNIYKLSPEWARPKLGTTNNLPSSTTEVAQATQQVQAAVADAIPKKEWATQVDISKVLKNVMDIMPKGLQNLIMGILWALWFSPNTTTEANTEKIKDISKIVDQKWSELLNSYWIKAYEWKEKWSTEFRFGEKANLTWTRVEKPGTANATDKKTEGEKIVIKEGKVILQEGARVTSITEPSTWKIEMKIQTKTGAIETYTITDVKKVEQQAKKA
jgi:hypothetical protein